METNQGTATGFAVRPATPDDDPAVVALLCQALGWEDDARHHALFEWKHRANPFGPSPGWVAEDEEGLVGFRTFMRWAFRVGSERVSAVRAVDTATHPRSRGRGVFRVLTMRGVEEMAGEGVAWVFNTPNDQSLPGYLSMGWVKVGRLQVSMRPARLSAVPRLVSARHPGDLWSLPTSAGEEAAPVLSCSEAVKELLLRCEQVERVRTDVDAAFLRWRYGASPVGYRVLLAGKEIAEGMAVFRLRRRGGATEAVIADVLVPRGRPETAARLCRAVVAGSGGDYAIALGRRPPGWLPLPGNGPVLTCRPLNREPPGLDEWGLCAGDIELF